MFPGSASLGLLCSFDQKKRTARPVWQMKKNRPYIEVLYIAYSSQSLLEMLLCICSCSSTILIITDVLVIFYLRYTSFFCCEHDWIVCLLDVVVQHIHSCTLHGGHPDQVLMSSLIVTFEISTSHQLCTLVTEWCCLWNKFDNCIAWCKLHLFSAKLSHRMQKNGVRAQGVSGGSPEADFCSGHQVLLLSHFFNVCTVLNFG